MVSLLKKIDMFGVAFSFNTFGKSKHTTNTGGILTIVTLTTIGVFTYLFGTDFFHKENPNLVESDLVHLKSKMVPLTNESSTFMFRLQDGNAKPHLNYDTMPYKVWGGYFHFRNNSKQENELLCWARGNEMITKCSNTKATLNPVLKAEKLEEWLCWDLEKIKTECRRQLGAKEPNYEPVLGGYNDEVEMAGLRFDVWDAIYDVKTNTHSNQATQEELTKFGEPILNIRYPNVSYDASAPYDALRIYNDAQILQLRAATSRRETRIMQMVTASDDHGWVFPNSESVSSLMPDRVEFEYGPSDYGNFKSFYNGYFYNIKKEKVYKRSFMKLQQLAAIVGGMVKSVIAVFGLYAIYTALTERDDLLQKEFYKVKVVPNSNTSELSLQNEVSQVNTIVATKEQGAHEKKSSFWTYFKCFCCRSAEDARRTRIFEQMRVYMRSKMDVTYLFKLFEQFSMMKELVLTEEQKVFVEQNETVVEVNA